MLIQIRRLSVLSPITSTAILLEQAGPCRFVRHGADRPSCGKQGWRDVRIREVVARRVPRPRNPASETSHFRTLQIVSDTPPPSRGHGTGESLGHDARADGCDRVDNSCWLAATTAPISTLPAGARRGARMSPSTSSSAAPRTAFGTMVDLPAQLEGHSDRQATGLAHAHLRAVRCQRWHPLDSC